MTKSFEEGVFLTWETEFKLIDNIETTMPMWLTQGHIL